MKKIAVFLLGILIVPSVFGQNDYKKFRFGLKGAPNISWMKPEASGLGSGNVALKFSYGLITEFALAENYLFATGLEILETGGTLDFTQDVIAVGSSDFLRSRKYNLQYLNIPLMLKMRTNEIGYLRYFGMFGFDLGLRTKATATDSKVGGSYQESNINNDIQLFRVALNLGAGVEYNLVGNTALVVNVNYSNAFTNSLRSRSETLYLNNTRLTQYATANFVALNVGIIF
jgi:opacity protein-like surface antigen